MSAGGRASLTLIRTSDVPRCQLPSTQIPEAAAEPLSDRAAPAPLHFLLPFSDTTRTTPKNPPPSPRPKNECRRVFDSPHTILGYTRCHARTVAHDGDALQPVFLNPVLDIRLVPREVKDLLVRQDSGFKVGGWARTRTQHRGTRTRFDPPIPRWFVGSVESTSTRSVSRSICQVGSHHR